jgi:hypothetical protein
MTELFTTRDVATILFEEFKRRGWGDVDPRYFDPELDPSELGDMEGLEEVVEAITLRINQKVDADFKDLMNEL